MTTKFASARITFIVITILGLILTLIPVKALAVESVFQGSFQKNDSLTAARVGKDVVITWNRDITKDVLYSVFVGEFIIRAGGRALPKIPVGSNVGTFTDSTRSNAIYSLIYQSNKVKQYNASGKIFFEHKVAVDNRNQAVILMKKTKDNFTYDYRIIVDRDGSVGAGFLKFGCRVSAWGLPLAKGVLSVSNLSLTMISYLPGGQAAGLAGTALDKFELIGDTSFVQGAEVVRGTATYVIKADQIDLWAKVKPRDALKLGLGGINANGAVRSIKRISKTDKFNLVVDIAVSANEINELYSTISTARSQYVETNALCAMLN